MYVSSLTLLHIIIVIKLNFKASAICQSYNIYFTIPKTHIFHIQSEMVPATNQYVPCPLIPITKALNLLQWQNMTISSNLHRQVIFSLIRAPDELHNIRGCWFETPTSTHHLSQKSTHCDYGPTLKYSWSKFHNIYVVYKYIRELGHLYFKMASRPQVTEIMC